MDSNQLYLLEKVKSTVDLGAHFDSNLTFSDQQQQQQQQHLQKSACYQFCPGSRKNDFNLAD